MSESSTVIVAPPPRSAPTAPSARARRVQLTPLRSVTRAHLALQHRQAVLDEARELLETLAKAFSNQLGVGVSFKASLADSTRPPLTSLASHAAFAVLEFGGDALGVVELDPLVLGSMLQHAAGSSGPAPVPVQLTRIEEAALGWQLLTALSLVRRHPFDARFSPRLVCLTANRHDVLERIDGRRKHVSILCTITIGDTAGCARLILPAKWLASALEQLPETPPQALEQAVAAAGFAVTCLVGGMALRAEEASALAKGDVLVFPQVTVASTGIHGPARLVGPTFELRGTLAANGFTLTRALAGPAQELPMTDSDSTLPIDVEIELTRLRLSVHELASLKQGAILPLHINGAQTLTLRIGDRAVARAELVDVDGEIGARILSLIERAS